MLLWLRQQQEAAQGLKPAAMVTQQQQQRQQDCQLRLQAASRSMREGHGPAAAAFFLNFHQQNEPAQTVAAPVNSCYNRVAPGLLQCKASWGGSACWLLLLLRRPLRLCRRLLLLDLLHQAVHLVVCTEGCQAAGRWRWG